MAFAPLTASIRSRCCQLMTSREAAPVSKVSAFALGHSISRRTSGPGTSPPRVSPLSVQSVQGVMLERETR